MFTPNLKPNTMKTLSRFIGLFVFVIALGTSTSSFTAEAMDDNNGVTVEVVKNGDYWIAACGDLIYRESMPRGAHDHFSREERLLLQMVDEMKNLMTISDETWMGLSSLYSTEQIFDFLSLYGIYEMGSKLSNALGIQPQ